MGRGRGEEVVRWVRRRMLREGVGKGVEEAVEVCSED